MPGDLGQIYMGGTSGSDDIDAGLQYNLHNPKSPNPEADEYGLYIRDVISGYANGFWALPGGSPQISKFLVPCGGTVLLAFAVETLSGTPQGSGVAFIVSVVGPNYSVWYVWETGQPTWYGWGDQCSNCLLKRTTSIAQSPGTIYNGDHFATQWSGVQLSCGFGLASCTNYGSMQDWGIGVTKGCDDWPNWDGTTVGSIDDCKNSSASQIVSVTGFNYTSENVSIQLPDTTSTPPPGNTINSGYMPSELPGLDYTVQAYPATSNGQLSGVGYVIALFNITDSPMTVGIMPGCGIFAQAMTASAPYQLLAQRPAPGTDRCSQLVQYITIDAHHGVIPIDAVLNFAFTQPVIFDVSILGLFPNTNGTVRSSAEHVQGMLLPVAPTPTPTPAAPATPTPIPFPRPTNPVPIHCYRNVCSLSSETSPKP